MGLPDFEIFSTRRSKAVSPKLRPPLPPGIIPGTHLCTYSCCNLSAPQGHSASRRTSTKNSSDPHRESKPRPSDLQRRNRDLPTYSVVPEPTAPSRAPDLSPCAGRACTKTTYTFSHSTISESLISIPRDSSTL